MKILVTGANGFLGQHLTLFLVKKGYEVFALGKGECRIPSKERFSYVEVDLQDAALVKETIANIQPGCIIHAAAMSKPDECELNKELCVAVNVSATEYLLQASEQLESRPFFIYTSTDFIFGEGGPHSETDIPAPLNFYGESKLMSERLVAASTLDWCIMRPVFIYGETWPGMRSGFLQWVQESLKTGKQIKVMSDQLRTPTYVTDICKGLDAIIQKRATGIYHLAGKDIISPYEMAIKVAEELKLKVDLIENATAATTRELVRRAKRSGLKIDKARLELAYEPLSFSEGIKLTFEANS